MQDKPHSMDEYDENTKITNTGQRIKAILVAVVAIVAVIAAVIWWNAKRADIERHEEARAAFQKAHTMGYLDFWKKSQVDIKELKSNRDFELRLKQILSDDPLSYAKFVKEKSLPILDKAVPVYKSIVVPQEYADKMSDVIKAVEKLRGAWNSFADEIMKLEDYFKGKKLLNKTADAWLGAQQSNNAKFKTNAFKYFNLLGCVLPDKKMSEMETTEINFAIKSSCSKDKAAWFRRVAYDCMPILQVEGEEPNKDYAATIKASRGAERMDHASKFGIEDCLKSTRGVMEEEIIEEIAHAWAGYVKAQNELLKAIEEELKKLR